MAQKRFSLRGGKQRCDDCGNFVNPKTHEPAECIDILKSRITALEVELADARETVRSHRRQEVMTSALEGDGVAAIAARKSFARALAIAMRKQVRESERELLPSDLASVIEAALGAFRTGGDPDAEEPHESPTATSPQRGQK